jgi:hypothetical protein
VCPVVVVALRHSLGGIGALHKGSAKIAAIFFSFVELTCRSHMTDDQSIAAKAAERPNSLWQPWLSWNRTKYFSFPH